jgi:hypothetical protein
MRSIDAVTLRSSKSEVRQIPTSARTRNIGCRLRMKRTSPHLLLGRSNPTKLGLAITPDSCLVSEQSFEARHFLFRH